MLDQYIIHRLAEMTSQGFGQVNRAVLAAGTANTNRQIATIVVLEARQPFAQVSTDIIKHLFHFRLLAQVLDDLSILTGILT